MSKSETRLYVVVDVASKKPVALIEAANQAQARNDWSNRTAEVRYAEQADIITAFKAGISPTKVGDEAAPAGKQSDIED